MKTTRKTRSIGGWFLFFVLGFTSHCSASDSGTISGTVHDGDGKPLNGVHIALTSREIPSTSFETKTDASGQYRFTGLGAGEYLVAADLPGYLANAALSVRIRPDGALATADINMIRSPQETTEKAASASHPKLEFESSGIRGLIDPGGYSASSAGAASGLLRGIADVKRTDKGSSARAAKGLPCGLEPQLRQAVEKNPESAEANRRLGQFYTAHDEPAKAIPLLKHALAIDARDDASSRVLAIAWLQSGDFEKAREVLVPLAEPQADHPADPEIHQLLARADEGLGQFKEATLQYRIAAAQDPSEESLFGIGYESVLAGSLSQGLDAFAAGVQRYPQSIALRIGLGTTQFLQGKADGAVHSFLDATDIDPNDPRPYSFLAATLGLTNDESDRLSATFKRFLDSRPDSASANYFYAQALSFNKTGPDSSRIESLLKHAIQSDPNLAKAHLLFADTLSQRNDYQDAVPEYEAALRLDNSLNEAHYRLALAYKRIDKPDLSSREMQIFRLSAQPKASASDAIDLAQFVSAMAAPDQDINRELQCPAAPR